MENKMIIRYVHHVLDSPFRARRTGAASGPSLLLRGDDMRQTDQSFYNSRKWRDERKIYKQTHPFCERCLAKGIYKPTEIVHHKEWLDDNKAKDAKLALNFSNLEALCFDCHNKEHFTGRQNVRRQNRRWHFENGQLVMNESPLVVEK